MDMIKFTEMESAYAGEHRMGRLATASTSGHPHVVPIAYHFDPEREVIKIGGLMLEGRGQDRHLQANPQAALVVDDVADGGPRGLLVKGTAILHTEGGEVLGQGFGPNWVEIVPRRVLSWGLDDSGQG